MAIGDACVSGCSCGAGRSVRVPLGAAGTRAEPALSLPKGVPAPHNLSHNLSHSANAFGVDTPTSGVITTHGCAGKSSSGYTCSPRPRPRTVPPMRNNGKSEPTSPAILRRSAGDKDFFNARSKPSMALTAFDEAPPSPPCTGNLFSISMTTRAFDSRAFIAFSTMRKQVFDSSRGTRGSAHRISIPVPRPTLTRRTSCSAIVW